MQEKEYFQNNIPKVIDLFSGVGGLSLGFELAGFTVEVANEYDPSIAMAYKKNHPSTKMIIGDITKLNLNSIFGVYKNKIDVLIGGPPCQGFSLKGKRLSLLDERNFLFKIFFEVINIVKPKYVLMENVPNLLTTENGFFKEEIVALFNQYGYTVDCGVLNAADFSVPQNRKRAFFLAKYGKTGLKLPKGDSKKISVWDAISDLSFLSSGEGSDEQAYLYSPQTEYQSSMRSNSIKLYNHKATKHSLSALKRLDLIPPNKGREYLPSHLLTKSIYSGTWSRINQDDQSVTITTRFDTPSSGRFTHPFLNRALTVREAARIQSFPDTFVFYGNKQSQMKQVGNAVPPLLAKSLAKLIIEDINKDITYE